jgi:hypothetical protein
LYISIRPVILTCLPSMPDSMGDLETGEAGGIQPVNVWFGQEAPILRNVFPLLLVNTLATISSTVAHSLLQGRSARLKSALLACRAC